MNALPWEDGSFDVVTSFRGIWGTTPGAVAEVHRVLVPGGRIGLTVWGHIKASPGAWALAPFRLASEPKVENQAAMVALGRPGAGEALLTAAGFTDVERVDIPFVFEFADPEAYARALASTGPAFEAIQAVGEEAFLQAAVELARERVRDGLPLRAPIRLVGYVATKPADRARRQALGAAPRLWGRAVDRAAGFLGAAPDTPDARELFDDDLQGVGYVTNMSRLWAHLPAALEELSDLMDRRPGPGRSLSAQRAVLVSATASALGDSYCSLAWGNKLAEAAGPDVAAAVIRGTIDGTRWCRAGARPVGPAGGQDPNAIVAGDVQALRDAGFDDQQIFAITSFVALRLAFSTVNDALGRTPDDMPGDVDAGGGSFRRLLRPPGERRRSRRDPRRTTVDRRGQTTFPPALRTSLAMGPAAPTVGRTPGLLTTADGVRELMRIPGLRGPGESSKERRNDHYGHPSQQRRQRRGAARRPRRL